VTGRGRSRGRVATVRIAGLALLLATISCGGATDAPTAAGGDRGWCAGFSDYQSALIAIWDDLDLDPEREEDSRMAATELLPLWVELQADAPAAVSDDVAFIRTVFDDEIDPSIDWRDIRWDEYDLAVDRIEEFCA
jgi:hypothetical protein